MFKYNLSEKECAQQERAIERLLELTLEIAISEEQMNDLKVLMRVTTAMKVHGDELRKGKRIRRRS